MSFNCKENAIIWVYAYAEFSMMRLIKVIQMIIKIGAYTAKNCA